MSFRLINDHGYLNVLRRGVRVLGDDPGGSILHLDLGGWRFNFLDHPCSPSLLEPLLKPETLAPDTPAAGPTFVQILVWHVLSSKQIGGPYCV